MHQAKNGPAAQKTGRFAINLQPRTGRLKLTAVLLMSEFRMLHKDERGKRRNMPELNFSHG